jgi:hypothetical protein
MYIRDFAIIGMFVFILAWGLAVLTFGDSTDDFSPETHFAGNNSVDLKRQGGHDSLAHNEAKQPAPSRAIHDRAVSDGRSGELVETGSLEKATASAWRGQSESDLEGQWHAGGGQPAQEASAGHTTEPARLARLEDERRAAEEHETKMAARIDDRQHAARAGSALRTSARVRVKDQVVAAPDASSQAVRPSSEVGYQPEYTASNWPGTREIPKVVRKGGALGADGPRRSAVEIAKPGSEFKEGRLHSVPLAGRSILGIRHAAGSPAIRSSQA